MNLPTTLATIEYGAFEWCTSLQTIHLPDSVTTLKPQAFAHSGLVSITIPEGVTQLEWHLFDDCEQLQEVTLPSTLTKIENNVFSGCEQLTEVFLPDSVEELGQSLFAGCTNLQHINIPSKVKKIPENCFARCAMREFVFPATVEKIGHVPFYSCPNLQSIEICNPNVSLHYNPHNLQYYALFFRCPQLTRIIIGGEERDLKEYENETGGY